MHTQLPITTLADIPPYNAKLYGKKAALLFEGRETSFEAFDIHSNQVANALLAAGLKAGDRIAYLGRNSDSYLELLFGAIRSGIVLVPISWRLAAPEVAYILDNSEARLLFADSAFASANTMVQSRWLKHIILMESDTPGQETFASWRTAQARQQPTIAIAAHDTAVQIYTSGTTGRPKGVLLTHRNFIHIRELLTAQGSAAGQYLPDDISLLAMPVSHVGGTSTAIWAMYHGIKSVVARQFEPHDVLDYIERDGVNSFFLVPSALQKIVHDPRARQVDFSRLRYITYGGSPMPHPLLKECMDIFGCGFVQGYGMTETCASIVQLSAQDHLDGDSPRLRSCGKPLPGVEIRIQDEHGHSLAAGEIGEIVTRSPGNMTGYWRDPATTTRTLDSAGWLRTGDAGYLDVDGYLYIHDRIKDMIVSGGENIYPAEVENAIYSHPLICEVAVIGVPSQQWGEEVKAIVVVKTGAQVCAQDVIAWARQRIAGFKVPKSVDFVDSIPKSGAGKVLKRELRKPFWAGWDRQVN